MLKESPERLKSWRKSDTLTLFSSMKLLKQKKNSTWLWSSVMVENYLITLLDILDSLKNRQANSTWNWYQVLNIFIKVVYATEIWNRKICYWIMIWPWKLLILVLVTCMSREQLSKLHVVLLVTQHQKWLQVKGTTGSKLIYGAVELFFMLWFVVISHLKTPKLQIYTRKSWMLNIHFLNSCQGNARISSDAFLILILNKDLAFRTSEITHGPCSWRTETEIKDYSQAKKKCQLRKSYSTKSSMNSILIKSMPKSALKIIDITILLHAII